MQNFGFVKLHVKRIKTQVQTGKEYLQTIYMAKAQYLDYVFLKNSQTSTLKTKTKHKKLNRYFTEQVYTDNKKINKNEKMFNVISHQKVPN